MSIILIIDDEYIIREEIRKLLERYNFIVEEANSGEQGLQMLSRNNVESYLKSYDAVILDVFMQYMSGIDCLREIRRLYKYLPVFLYTDKDNMQIRKDAEELNATGYFIHKNLNEQDINLFYLIVNIYKDNKKIKIKIEPEIGEHNKEQWIRAVIYQEAHKRERKRRENQKLE